MTILPLAVMVACHPTEEQEAEALFAQQSQEAMESFRQHQAAIATSTVGQEVAEAIVACLEREQVHPYGLQLSVMVHPDGLRLSELAAADPLLAPTVQATCLQDVIGAARPTVNPLLAAAEPPVHEAHELLSAHERRSSTLLTARACGTLPLSNARPAPPLHDRNTEDSQRLAFRSGGKCS